MSAAFLGAKISPFTSPLRLLVLLSSVRPLSHVNGLLRLRAVRTFLLAEQMVPFCRLSHSLNVQQGVAESDFLSLAALQIIVIWITFPMCKGSKGSDQGD